MYLPINHRDGKTRKSISQALLQLQLQLRLQLQFWMWIPHSQRDALAPSKNWKVQVWQRPSSCCCLLVEGQWESEEAAALLAGVGEQLPTVWVPVTELPPDPQASSPSKDFISTEPWLIKFPRCFKSCSIKDLNSSEAWTLSPQGLEIEPQMNPFRH